jgi:transcriptional regulator with XRE-family HTH domain
MAAEDFVEVGATIRSIREQRGYSQRSLARRSGLSANAISRIERGESSPTVSTLHQLAAALKVPIVDFFVTGQQLATILVRREHRPSTRGEGVLIESLGSGLPDQMLEPFLMTLMPGTVSGADPISHAGEEFVYCLDGQVEYLVDEQWHRLEVGDSLLFQSQQSHLCRNSGTEKAVVFIVILAVEEAVRVSPHEHLLIAQTNGRDVTSDNGS